MTGVLRTIMSLFILNHETNFEHIIGVLFNNWTALKVNIATKHIFKLFIIVIIFTFKLAVEHGMGGSSEVMQFKISDLIKNIHECLRKSGLYIISSSLLSYYYKIPI